MKKNQRQIFEIRWLMLWLWVMAAHSTVHASDDFSRFNGTFVYSHEASEEQGRIQAIEDVVQQLNFVIRAYARKRISDRLKPYQTLAFQFHGETLATRFDDYPERKTPLDGRRVYFKDTKGRDAFIQRTRDRALIHERGGRDGNVRTSVYRFSEDGQTLFVDVTIESVRLPDAIRYRLTYKKKPV